MSPQIYLHSIFCEVFYGFLRDVVNEYLIKVYQGNWRKKKKLLSKKSLGIFFSICANDFSKLPTIWPIDIWGNESVITVYCG